MRYTTQMWLEAQLKVVSIAGMWMIILGTEGLVLCGIGAVIYQVVTNGFVR